MNTRTNGIGSTQLITISQAHIQINVSCNADQNAPHTKANNKSRFGGWVNIILNNNTTHVMKIGKKIKDQTLRASIKSTPSPIKGSS